MRVFLTGARGFVGAHLLTRLLTDGHDVALLARPGGDPWRIEDRLAEATVIAGTLDEPGALAAGLSRFAPDTVIHAGWEGVGNAFHDDPAQEKNLLRTRALLRLSADAGAGAWIGLGSQAEYGPRDHTIAETESTQPITAYGRAKLAAYQEAHDFCADAGMRFAWIRLFSTYGPKDNPGWFLTSLILALLRSEEMAMTEGTQLWDYLYVADAADAIARVASGSGVSGVFNLAAGAAVSIRSIAERTRDLIDPSLPLGIGKVPYAPGKTISLKADVSRLRDTTGWSPATALEDGLAETVAWFRDNRSRYPTKPRSWSFK